MNEGGTIWQDSPLQWNLDPEGRGNRRIQTLVDECYIHVQDTESACVSTTTCQNEMSLYPEYENHVGKQAGDIISFICGQNS